MSDYYCNLCDETSKRRYKNKLSKTKSHAGSIKYILTKYILKNANFLQVDDILKKHISDFDRKCWLSFINCHFKFVFEDF